MDKFKVGLIGYGYIGRVHSIGYLNASEVLNKDFAKGIEMSLLVRRRDSPSEKGNWAQVCDSIEELADKKVDLADVCTPNFMHLSQVSCLIKNGINIYCEKPLGLDFEEAIGLSKLAEENGVFNQAALVYRFMPAIAKARSFIKSGGLGRITNFRTQLFHSSYLNPERPLSWRLEREKSGGGALIDLGIHLADTIRFLLGEVEALRGEGRTIFKKRFDEKTNSEVNVDVDEWFLTTLQMENGAVGTIEVSKVSQPSGEGFYLEVYGTKGSLRITEKNCYEPDVYRFNDKDGSVDRMSLKPEDDYARYLYGIYPSQRMSLGSMADMHMASQMNIIKTLREGKAAHPETPTFREAALSQRIIDAAYKSSLEEGKRIQL